MSVIGKIMGIAKKNNAQLYWHNGLTPKGKPKEKHLQSDSQDYKTVYSLLTKKLSFVNRLGSYCHHFGRFG